MPPPALPIPTSNMARNIQLKLLDYRDSQLVMGMYFQLNTKVNPIAIVICISKQEMQYQFL